MLYELWGDVCLTLRCDVVAAAAIAAVRTAAASHGGDTHAHSETQAVAGDGVCGRVYVCVCVCDQATVHARLPSIAGINVSWLLADWC